MGFDNRGKVRLSMKFVDQESGEEIPREDGDDGDEDAGEEKPKRSRRPRKRRED
jgi:polyribonucleotide nucleotidyltransferase